MKQLLIIISLQLLALPSFADESQHPVTLWQVSGTNNSVYLLGSIHLLREEDYPLPTVLSEAYEEAEVLIMEIDMDDLDPVAAQTALTKYGVLHDEQTLQGLMGSELYAEAEAAAIAIDIPLDMLAKTDPWYAAMTIELMMLSRLGFNPNLGIETHMMSKAGADGKSIEGLETIEEQVLFLDRMSLPAQREMLLSTLAESTELGEVMDELIAAWRHGDTEYLVDNMLDELAQHEELSKTLVTDRNTRWVAQIEPLLNDNDDFLIIVGALHLIGPEGVPKQLSRRGYAVRQLSESPTLR